MILSFEERLLIGRLLAAAGIMLFGLWIFYFMHLVRPIDAWDFSPLPAAIALLLLGGRFVGLRKILLARAAVSYKRDLLMALALGTVAELGILIFTGNHSEMPRLYVRLERIQEPGIRVAEALYRHLYADLGRTGSLWVAQGCALAILIAFWSLGAFTVLRTLRFFLRLNSK
jgi:hypothetical protein